MSEQLKASDILKKRNGYKAVLTVELKDFVLSVPIRHETMNSKDIKEKNKVVFKDSVGKAVAKKYVGEKKELKWLGEDGTEGIGNVLAYQVQKDGKEVVVEPFEKTEDIKIVKVVDKTIKEDFLCERTVELWSDEQGKLFKLADYLERAGQVALASFNTSKGYDTQYLMIIEPKFIDETKFGLVGYLARKHLVFNHLMDMSVKHIEKAQAKGIELVEGIL